MNTYPYLYDADINTTSLRLVRYYNEHHRFYRMNEHCHDAFEIMYVKEGRCTVTCVDPISKNENKYTLKENSFIYVYSGIKHNLFIDREHPCRILNVELETCESNRSVLSYFNGARDITEFLKKREYCCFLGDDGTMYKIISLLQTVDCEVSREIMSAELLFTLAHMIESGFNTDSVYVSAIKKYIAANYDLGSELTLRMIADKVHLSPSYMQKLFKKEVGMSVFEYIGMLRLERAKQLLCTSDMSMVEIAICSGLGSRQRLNAVISESEGMSPKMYREMSQNKVYRKDNSEGNNENSGYRKEND